MSDDENQPLIERPNRSLSFDVPSSKRHWRNLIVLSTTFLLCFTALGAIQNIQSSVNTSDALGVISLATIYGSLMLSCLLAPAVIKLLGAKWTIVSAILCYCSYFSVNFFFGYATLSPTSFVLVFSAAPLWVAQGTYLTSSAIQLAALVDEVPEFVIRRFNGVFFAVFQTNQIFGNLLLLNILYAGMNDEKPTNVSSCGVLNCGTDISSSALAPSVEKVQLLFIIYCFIGVVVVLFLICLSQQPSATTRIDTGSSFSSVLASMMASVVATLRLTVNWKLFLLIPVFIYSGFEQAFIVGNFTKAFVACTLGVSHVSLVMMAFAGSDVIGSLLIGLMAKFTGRIFLFCLGSVVHCIVMVGMSFWKPTNDIQDSWKLYLMAAGWGIGDAVFQTQCASIIGTIFGGCQEHAFTNYRFWQSLGFFIWFVSSIPGGVCISQSLSDTFLFWLLLSMVMYLICEYKIRRENYLYLLDDS